MYLAFDPGESTGVAEFNEDGSLIKTKTLRGADGVFAYLTEMDSTRLLAIIVEEFRLYKGRAMQQSGSRMDTSQIEGAIKLWARQRGVPIYLQRADIKSIAYKWAGITKPKAHDLSHETDAYVHGVYWLQKQNIRKPGQGTK